MKISGGALYKQGLKLKIEVRIGSMNNSRANRSDGNKNHDQNKYEAMTDSLRHNETIMQERQYVIAPASIYWHDTSNDLMDTKKIHKRKAEVVDKKVVSAKFELR